MYVKSNTLLVADVFENLQCLKIYEIDPGKFVSTPGSPWQGSLKKTKVKLDLLTEINMLLMADMLLMAGRGIQGGICQSI